MHWEYLNSAFKTPPIVESLKASVHRLSGFESAYQEKLNQQEFVEVDKAFSQAQKEAQQIKTLLQKLLSEGTLEEKSEFLESEEHKQLLNIYKYVFDNQPFSEIQKNCEEIKTRSSFEKEEPLKQGCKRKRAPM